MQADLYEFETNMVYRAPGQPDYTEKPYLEKQNKKVKQNNNNQKEHS